MKSEIDMKKSAHRVILNITHSSDYGHSTASLYCADPRYYVFEVCIPRENKKDKFFS